MLLPDGQVDAKPIPGAAMAIMEMAFQPRAQILCKPYIVKFSLLIKGIDPVPSTNVLLNDLLVLLQSFTRDIFEMLANKVAHKKPFLLLCYYSVVPTNAGKPLMAINTSIPE